VIDKIGNCVSKNDIALDRDVVRKHSINSESKSWHG